MKKTLFALLLSCLSLLASAQTVGKITPEGTPEWYQMDAYLQASNGTVMYHGLVVQVSYSADGQWAYFKGLFPVQFPELWIRGKVSGQTIVFDRNEVIASQRLYDDYGTPYDYQIKMGEPIFDPNYMGDDFRVIGMNDVVYQISGDRMYIVDSTREPMHPAALYVEEDGEKFLYDWTFCNDLKPYTGSTEIITPPANAVIKPYNYDYADLYLQDVKAVGNVAVSGNDYYFDMLTPGQDAWVKGTREGNTITIKSGQLLSHETFWLRFGGLSYYSQGRMNDFKLTIDDATGIIQEADMDKFFAIVYMTDGSLADYNCNFVLTPFAEGEKIVPGDPEKVHFGTYGSQYELDFELYAVDDKGNALNASQLGYYIYVNGQRYTFKKSKYPYINSQELTFIPYQYCDDYTNGDIWCDYARNSVFISESGVSTLGVQAVYRISEGNEVRSNIIQVDRYNSTKVIPDEQVSSLLHIAETNNATQSVFDIYGRHTNKLSKGLNIVDGRKVLVK